MIGNAIVGVLPVIFGLYDPAGNENIIVDDSLHYRTVTLYNKKIIVMAADDHLITVILAVLGRKQARRVYICIACELALASRNYQLCRLCRRCCGGVNYKVLVCDIVYVNTVHIEIS